MCALSEACGSTLCACDAGAHVWVCVNSQSCAFTRLQSIKLTCVVCWLCRGSLVWMAEGAIADRLRRPWKELWPEVSWPPQSSTVRGLRWWNPWLQGLMMAELELRVCFCMSHNHHSAETTQTDCWFVGIHQHLGKSVIHYSHTCVPIIDISY